jgi:hypothetical protein
MAALHTKDLSTAQALVALNAGIEKAKEMRRSYSFQEKDFLPRRT